MRGSQRDLVVERPPVAVAGPRRCSLAHVRRLWVSTRRYSRIPRRPAWLVYRLGEEQEVCRVYLASAVPVLEDQDLHPAEPADEVAVAGGARLRPQAGGFQHRRAGHSAPSPAGGCKPIAASARVAAARQRSPWAMTQPSPCASSRCIRPPSPQTSAGKPPIGSPH